MKNLSLRKLGIFSLILIIVGVFLIIYSRFYNCAHLIEAGLKNNEISFPLKGKPTAIYLVTNVNTFCRPCANLETFKQEDSINIVFFVPNDFTPNDISNFRESFDLTEKYFVLKIDSGWQKIYNKCIKDKKNNILILIRRNLKVSKIMRF